jgi:hypothetical protein
MIKEIDGASKCCLCTFITTIVLIILVGGAFNIAGLIFSCLGLKEVTDRGAYTCMICIIVAYSLGVLITMTLVMAVFCSNDTCRYACSCFNTILQSFASTYMFAIFIYSQVVYWGSRKGTFCNGGECSYQFTIGMLGYIISYYATIGLYIMLIIACSSLGLSIIKGAKRTE